MAFDILVENLRLKILISLILGYLISLLGNDILAISAIAALIVVDWVIAVLAAIKNKRFCSWYLGVTLYKIAFYLALLIMAHQALKINLIPHWFDDVIELFIAVTEIKSILENSALFGFKYAKKLENKLDEFLDEKIKKF